MPFIRPPGTFSHWEKGIFRFADPNGSRYEVHGFAVAVQGSRFKVRGFEFEAFSFSVIEISEL